MNEPVLFLLTKYSKMGVSVISQKTGTKYNCAFQNGIFKTTNPDEASALRTGAFYGVDYTSDMALSDEAKDMINVHDEFGDNYDVAMKIKDMKRAELVSLASKVRKPSDQGFNFMKLKNVELQDYIIKQAHKLQDIN